MHSVGDTLVTVVIVRFNITNKLQIVQYLKNSLFNKQYMARRTCNRTKYLCHIYPFVWTALLIRVRQAVVTIVYASARGAAFVGKFLAIKTLYPLFFAFAFVHTDYTDIVCIIELTCECRASFFSFPCPEIGQKTWASAWEIEQAGLGWSAWFSEMVVWSAWLSELAGRSALLEQQAAWSTRVAELQAKAGSGQSVTCYGA